MAGITLERLTIAGFRAYLHEQEVTLRQHATSKSLAVFAPKPRTVMSSVMRRRNGLPGGLPAGLMVLSLSVMGLLLSRGEG